MKLNLKTKALLLIITTLIISSVYIIFFYIEENDDNEPPTIDTISGDIFGKKGDIITIYVTFLDNINVTNASIYYRATSDTDWISKSILNGSVDILLNSNQNLYYYVTVDDDAGNGPVGNPSIDGSVYYTINVLKDDGNEDYIRNVFVEEGSFTTCQYCPIVAKMLYELYSSGNYNFFYVTLIKTNEKASYRLDNEYNLFGLPTVFIDGGYKVLMGGKHEKPKYAQTIRGAESRRVPKIKIKVIAEYDNITKNLISDIFVKNMDDETYDGQLRVYLTEKISRWSGPEGEPYHFGFLDYITNKEISLDTDENASYSVTQDISDLDAENLMVIAVIFNSEKKQGYSDPLPQGDNKYPFDAYYADNVDGTEVVEGGNLPPTVGFSIPEIGKLHIIGKPRFDFIFHKKTILIGTTKLVANATDDKKIEKIEFYINDKLVGEDTEEPYEYSFKKVKSFKRFFRKYTVSVIAYDNEGKTGTGSIDILGFFL